MNRITASAELSKDELQDAPDEEWLSTLLEHDNELSRQVVAQINQNLPMLNSPVSKLVDLTLVHGASVTVKNPLSVPIRSVTAVACVGLSVDSTGKPTRGTYNLSLPQIEWHQSGKQDGSVIITPAFPAPTGFAQLSRNAAQACASGSSNFISWDAANSLTGALSWSLTSNPTRLTATAAGIVLVTSKAVLTNGSTANSRYGWVEKNRDSYRYAMQANPANPTAAFATSLNGSAHIVVAANDYLEQIIFQDSGFSINTPANAIDCCMLTAQYVAPVGTTGKVTLFFAGGS